MKDLLKDAIFIAITVLIILAGCSRSIVIDINESIFTKADTGVVVKSDITEVEDTARTPISFEVTIEPWPDEI